MTVLILSRPMSTRSLIQSHMILGGRLQCMKNVGLEDTQNGKIK